MRSGEKRSSIYSELARYYDLIYEWKDYGAEVKFLKELIAAKKKSIGNELLDVGCGTGKHISLLRDRFKCTGLDLSADMLAIARKNVKSAKFVKGNMTDFDLRKKFDVILCLFSAIAYTRNDRNLERTLKNFSRHLEDGGIAVIQPWVPKDKWKTGHIAMDTYVSDDVKIARLSYSGGDSRSARLRMEYLVAEQGKGITHAVEEDSFPYFDRAKYELLMKRSGLSAEYISHRLFHDRGLLIGTK